jgi:hypothetical protein
VTTYGAWWAPKELATIFNNYVSEGLRGNSLYDGMRVAGNALNMVQLGLSGFHATFIALDTMNSRLALALQQASRLELGRAGVNAALTLSPTTVVSTIRKGAQLKHAFLDPANATPEMQQMVRLLTQGGGRINMDTFYRSNASGAFFKSLTDLKNPAGAFREAWQMVKDTPLTAPLRIVGRILETTMEPLMGHMVPNAKLGVFSALAEDWIRRNPTASPEATSRAMIQFWDSVENRMGQMAYDNLFWNKTLKDIAFVSTRSVGWNLGTVRELGGGAVDAVNQTWKALSGQQRFEITTRMAYLMTMPLFAGLFGSMICYLVTGKGPESRLDMYYPPDGKDGRLQIPGYLKDVIAVSKNPVQTFLNKLHPLLSTGSQIAQNKDYYGRAIYNRLSDDNRAVSYLEYLLNQTVPFSIRAMMKQSSAELSPMAQALSFWGIQPAPDSVVNPEKMEGLEALRLSREVRPRARAQNREGWIRLQ